MSRTRTLLSCLLCWLTVPLGAAPVVLDDCESIAGWKAAGGAAVAKAPSAAVGQGALAVTLPGTVQRELSNRPLPGCLAWDTAAGLSFQVKGDGSDQFGCLAVGTSHAGAYTYVAYFPLRDTNWHPVTVAWADFVPESQCEALGAPGGLPPSGINVLRFGSRWNIWHNNQPMPKVTFAVDQITVVEQAPAVGPAPKLRPFEDVVARLKAKQPVRIVCMGDSITAGTALANKDQDRYAVGVQQRLRDWLGSPGLTCVSRAVGGARLNDARAWVPRDFAGDPPDLVTVLYGYNDKSNTFCREYFKRSLLDYLERLARRTGGRTAVLLMATLPGTGPRFLMLDDFAEVVRQTAKEQGLPCLDLHQAFKAIGREAIEDEFADMAHPNEAGHQRLADLIARYLAGAAGVTPPKAAAATQPTVEPGQPQRWTFAAGLDGWRLDGGDEVRLAAGQGVEGRGALEYQMVAKPAKDHRRAWSPLVAVKPGQRYVATAQVKCLTAGTGTVGLYLASYADAPGTGEPQISLIRAAGNLVGRWEPVTGKLVIPARAAAIRLLVWSSRDSTGSFLVGDVALTPK